jgi:hypothetical protein
MSETQDLTHKLNSDPTEEAQITAPLESSCTIRTQRKIEKFVSNRDKTLDIQQIA